MTRSLGARIIAACAVVVVVVIGLSAAIFWTAQSASDSSAKLRGHNQTLRDVSSLQVLLQSIERGVDDFVITGDEAYLAPSEADRASIEETLRGLESRARDEPLVANLRQLAAAKFVFVDEVVAARRSGGFEAAQALVVTGEGQALMSSIRGELDTLTASAVERIESERQAEGNAQSLNIWLFGIRGVLVIGIVGTAAWVITRELRRRRSIERELLSHVIAEAQARNFADAALDSTNEGLVVVGHDHTIVAANRRFGELFGPSPEEIRGLPNLEIARVLSPLITDFDQMMAAVAGTVADPDRILILPVVQHAPERRQLELYSAPVKGRAAGHVGRLYAFRDVTGEREVERLKSEFVSMVSHELRTPLTSIKGYIDLLAEGEAGPLSESQAAYLATAQENANRLLRLINDLLDIARTEAGHMEVHVRRLELEPLIERAMVTMQPEFAARGQHATATVGELPAVTGDDERIMQVLLNLLSNASKYTPEEGRVDVTAAVEGDAVAVHIQDSGIGLSQEEERHVFNRFFRARNRSTRGVGGTGLGLAIVKALVELQGGTVSVESTPGTGSRFSFTLPIDRFEAERALAGTRQSNGMRS